MTNKEEEEPPEIALARKKLHFEGLEPHNRSVDLILQAIQRNDAKIEFAARPGRRYHRDENYQFSINVNGMSGIPFSFDISFQPKHAEILLGRIDEIDLSKPKQFSTLFKPFRTLDFQIYTYDARDESWDHICIHEDFTKPKNCWSGDYVAAIIDALACDLQAALKPKMTTLRQMILYRYPTAWFTNRTPPETTAEYVTKYCETIRKLQKIKDEDELKEKCKIAHEELFG